MVAQHKVEVQRDDAFLASVVTGSVSAVAILIAHQLFAKIVTPEACPEQLVYESFSIWQPMGVMDDITAYVSCHLQATTQVTRAEVGFLFYDFVLNVDLLI